jgi:hypothetical protein
MRASGTGGFAAWSRSRTVFTLRDSVLKSVVIDPCRLHIVDSLVLSGARGALAAKAFDDLT